MSSKVLVKSIAICLIIFGDRINNLFIIKVKIIMLIEWSYKPLSIMSTDESRMIGIFEHFVQFVLILCFLGVSF